jgi:hypothetical protein
MPQTCLVAPFVASIFMLPGKKQSGLLFLNNRKGAPGRPAHRALSLRADCSRFVGGL